MFVPVISCDYMWCCQALAVGKSRNDAQGKTHHKMFRIHPDGLVQQQLPKDTTQIARTWSTLIIVSECSVVPDEDVPCSARLAVEHVAEGVDCSALIVAWTEMDRNMNKYDTIS